MKVKKELNPEFKKYADEFYTLNKTYFEASLVGYNKVLQKLKTVLDFTYPYELEFEQLIAIDNKEIKEGIISIGLDFYDLKLAVRKKAVSEFLVHNNGMSVHLLRICEEAHQYFTIKDAIVNVENLLNPIKVYQQGSLDEAGQRNLYLHIKSYQDNFNNHHLKKYAMRLFGMSYKDIVKIKEACFEQTFNSYTTIHISQKGTVYTKKDGTQTIK